MSKGKSSSILSVAPIFQHKIFGSVGNRRFQAASTESTLVIVDSLNVDVHGGSTNTPMEVIDPSSLFKTNEDLETFVQKTQTSLEKNLTFS